MEAIEHLSSVVQLILGVGAIIATVAGGILWAIKVCVERLLTDIRDNISKIRVMVTEHTNVHKKHEEMIQGLYSKTDLLETRIYVIESSSGNVISR